MREERLQSQLKAAQALVRRLVSPSPPPYSSLFARTVAREARCLHGGAFQHVPRRLRQLPPHPSRDARPSSARQRHQPAPRLSALPEARRERSSRRSSFTLVASYFRSRPAATALSFRRRSSFQLEAAVHSSRTSCSLAAPAATEPYSARQCTDALFNELRSTSSRHDSRSSAPWCGTDFDGCDSSKPHEGDPSSSSAPLPPFSD
jgi:hypothetical protein